MKSHRNLLYINANIKHNEFIYSGIDFAEFIEFSSNPINNLMLISSGDSVLFLESNFNRGFELIEGQELMTRLARYNIYGLGNFCFVDYIARNDPEKLEEEQLAELLYLGHMFKPLHSPFFDELGNRYAYLAHDDGFYCKLFCRNKEDFIDVLSGKIQSSFAKKTNLKVGKLSNPINNRLLEFATNGMLIDFNDLRTEDNITFIKVYLIGKYANMDDIINNSNTIKKNTKEQYLLMYMQNKWIIRDGTNGEGQ